MLEKKGLKFHPYTLSFRVPFHSLVICGHWASGNDPMRRTNLACAARCVELLMTTGTSGAGGSVGSAEAPGVETSAAAGVETSGAAGVETSGAGLGVGTTAAGVIFAEEAPGAGFEEDGLPFWASFSSSLGSTASVDAGTYPSWFINSRHHGSFDAICRRLRAFTISETLSSFGACEAEGPNLKMYQGHRWQKNIKI